MEHIGSSGTAELPLQEICQCSLELFQEEISQIDPVVLRQIATCCVNDFRNILILHDKRILGVILEELTSLENRQVISAEEKGQLERGIADTLLPGTSRMKGLLERSSRDEKVKDFHLVKPIRDGSGNGIRLRKDIDQGDWLKMLERLSEPTDRPTTDTCIVQRLVDYIWYDIVRNEGPPSKPDKCHLIGSHHVVNSKLSRPETLEQMEDPISSKS